MSRLVATLFATMVLVRQGTPAFYRGTVAATWVYLAPLLRGMIDIHELSPELAPPSGSVADTRSYKPSRRAVFTAHFQGQ